MKNHKQDQVKESEILKKVQSKQYIQESVNREIQQNNPLLSKKN